ncbi:hypothetical protein [Leptolyngbya sp. O-77]|uniref:hypothetical protein n=1 Tax=Leptolyngbya sp. O-77 TaxID=1080068 RepID=UPI0012E3E6A9|nr:hypothetical protein [Leptolyngbya sp. O-77]
MPRSFAPFSKCVEGVFGAIAPTPNTQAKSPFLIGVSASAYRLIGVSAQIADYRQRGSRG